VIEHGLRMFKFLCFIPSTTHTHTHTETETENLVNLWEAFNSQFTHIASSNSNSKYYHCCFYL
jgi:hypothetical protein